MAVREARDTQVVVCLIVSLGVHVRTRSGITGNLRVSVSSINVPGDHFRPIHEDGM